MSAKRRGDEGKYVTLADVRKRILASLTSLSVILLLATLGLWIRSYWHMDTLTVARSKTAFRAYSSVGGIYFDWVTFAPPRTQWLWGYDRSEAWVPERIFGRGSRWRGVATMPGYNVVIISHWLLALLFAIAPGAWLWRRRKSTRPGGFPLGSPSSPAKPNVAAVSGERMEA